MSHHRKSRYAEADMIMTELKGLDNELEGNSAELLQKYRNIELGTQALKERAAAQIAFETVTSKIEDGVKYQLSELGVLPPTQEGEFYNSAYANIELLEERKFKANLIRTNKEFLEEWDRLLKEDNLTNNTAELEAIVNRTRNLFQIPDVLINFVKAKGFTIDMANYTNAEITKRGFSFVAKDAEGNQIDVKYGGGQMFLHFEEKNNNGFLCQRKSKALNDELAQKLQEELGIYMQTKSEGVGWGNEAQNTAENTQNADFLAQKKKNLQQNKPNQQKQ